MKKLYLIYHNDVESGVTPHLYAFTNDKNLAKGFMHQRKKDMFSLQIHEIPKDDAYYRFIQENTGKMLGNRKYYCKGETFAGYYKKSFVEIVSTSDEEVNAVLEGDKLLDTITKDGKSLQYLTKPILKLFEVLGIKNYLPIKDTYIDELEVFLKLYGGTLSDNFDD